MWCKGWPIGDCRTEGWLVVRSKKKNLGTCDFELLRGQKLDESTFELFVSPENAFLLSLAKRWQEPKLLDFVIGSECPLFCSAEITS